MKKLLVVAGVAAASLSFAQNSFQAPANMGLRIGYVLPIDSTMRDVAPNYIGLGLDFPVQFKLLPEGETVVSIDWMGKSGSGAHGNVFPFMINQRFYSKVAPGVNRSYFFFGGGVALVDLTSSNTVLAAQAGYGAELGENLYGEGKFLYTDAAGGAHGTSVGFYIGYRF